MFVVISIFIAGLMVGRSPEYLGKKIEGKEVRFAILYVALYPCLILLGAAWSILVPYGLSSIQNSGPHGLSEILYAYTSAAQNNGSAFAGLNGNTLWYNLTLALVMFLGRFVSIVLGLAIASSMVNKKIIQVSTGTFPSHGFLFIGLLIGVILIIGALTYFPVLILGPFTEHLFSLQGKMS
jgi:K+-transporting ATPase ATPase A chain